MSRASHLFGNVDTKGSQQQPPSTPDTHHFHIAATVDANPPKSRLPSSQQPCCTWPSTPRAPRCHSCCARRCVCECVCVCQCVSMRSSTQQHFPPKLKGAKKGVPSGSSVLWCHHIQSRCVGAVLWVVRSSLPSSDTDFAELISHCSPSVGGRVGLARRAINC